MRRLGLVVRVESLRPSGARSKLSTPSVSVQTPQITTSLAITNEVQHYLLHLLKEKLISSKSRIIFVSSGGVRGVSDTSENAHHDVVI